MNHKNVSGVDCRTILQVLKYYDLNPHKKRSRAELLTASGLKESDFKNKKLPWSDFIRFTKEMKASFEDIEHARDVIRHLSSRGLKETVHNSLLQLILSPKMLFRFWNTFIGPSLFSGLDCSYYYAEPDVIHMTLIAPPEFPDCSPYFSLCSCGMEVINRQIGYPDNELIYEKTESHSHVMHFKIATRSSMGLRFRHFLKRGQSRKALEDTIKNFEDIYQNSVSQKLDLQKNLQKQQKMALLGQLTSTIAHEINNPVAVISGNLQFLRDETKMTTDDPKMSAVLQTCLDTCAQVAKTVDSIASFNKQSLNPKKTSLSVLLKQVFELITPTAQRKRIELKQADVKEDLFIWVSPHQFIQALCNLMLNAIEAAEQGEQQWVLVEVGQETSLDKGYVVIRVKDSGPGIPEKNLNQIFTPFFSLKEGGSGLGLSISRSLIEKNEGLLKVENRAHPTTFSIKLPLFKES